RCRRDGTGATMSNGAGMMKTPVWIGAATAACLVMGLAAAPAAADELRIGFLAPMTGPFAQVGKDMVNGFEMYLDSVKKNFGGTTVKFIVEDEQAKPPVSVLKAEKLIRQDQGHTFVGGDLASNGYALAPVSTRENTGYIPSIPTPDHLTPRHNSQSPSPLP